MSNFDQMSDDIAAMLDGVNRYNPGNLELLEDYVNAQFTENRYDLEANFTVLKLYQLNPDKFKVDVVVKILLKCLMNLPHTDFVLAKCLIDQNRMDEIPIKKVFKLAEDMEVCQFESVWETIRSDAELFESVRGFAESVREFICHVVSITYQNIGKNLLSVLLGSISESELKAVCLTHGWNCTDDGYVHVSNMEDRIKSRNIAEKIDFTSIQDIMRAVA